MLTFTCRPNSPDGALRPLPDARPLVCDEAYFEYCGETAVPLLDDGVIVLRTFSKAFGLAGARIGYALASLETAAELNARQAPAPVSTLSATLAVAALASPPDVRPVIEERERLASALRAIELPPLVSNANFLFVPVDGRPRARRLAAPPGARRPRLRRRDPDHDPRPGRRRLPRRDARPAARPSGAGCRRRRPPRPPPAGDRRDPDRRPARASTARAASASRRAPGIYDHFLEQLAFHAGLDLVVEATGDLETGDHHTVEDTALAFGEALDQALGDRRGIARYGDATVPMDDALARAAVDLGGRPFAELALDLEPGMAGHFFGSLAQAARMAIHVEASGRDAHHTAEAAYKAVGRALKTALRVESSGIPSTKGTL